MRIFLKCLSVLSAAVLLSGCSGSSGVNNDIASAESKLERNLTPNVDDGELKVLASNNNAFAFDMFAKLQASESGNLFFSPYSISEALAMTYAGANADTKAQMAQALHFDRNDTRLHNDFNALDLHLNYSDTNYTFSVANSLWAQQGYEFVPAYLDTIKVNYGAGVNLVDFQQQTEKARVAINSWVEEKTKQNIKNLIPQGVLSSNTKLVLTNAVYFKGMWANQFEEAVTRDAVFTRLDGSTKETPMMRQQEAFAYTETERYQAIELPYKNNRTSMVVLLPKENKHSEVLSGIEAIYAEAVSAFAMESVDLKLPKFKFTTGLYQLTPHFKAMGMIDAFTPSADFSKMSISSELMIAAILHKAFVSVDEEGTEAAAATAVIMNDTAAPAAPKEMFVERPFLFFIKDQKSDQILFTGLVEEPVL